MKGYIGTYASTKENGIYQFSFDEGTKNFIECSLYLKDKDTKYLSLYKNVLAYPFALEHGAIKMIRDHVSDTAENEKHVSCYITQDEHYIYTANYHDGTVLRYRKEDNHITGCETIEIKEKAGTHQVILQTNKLLVPCLLLDCIMVYDRATLAYDTTIPFPKGSGPRHGVLNKNQSYLYVVSENSCEVFCIDVMNQYAIQKVLPLLQGIEHGSAGAIRKSEDDRFLYVSIRECNRIYVIDIKQWKVVQCVESGGDHPRDIALDPSQQFLFVSNRFSNNVIVFERDCTNGRLHQVAKLDDVIEGVSIVFEGGN